MTSIPIELWLEQLKFLPGREVYRCKLVSKEWKSRIENCESLLPVAPTYPSTLNPDDAHETVQVSENKLVVSFIGSSDDDSLAGCVRANCSIPKDLGLYYFEIKVINGGDHHYIGIGLSQEGVDLNGLPGWRWRSYGYHGDDGRFYDSRGWGKDYGPTFDTGDVIGCGINFAKHELFYTKNGERLDAAKKGVIFAYKQFYPLIGLNSPGEVVGANFGNSPFAYDIQPLIEEIRNLPTSWTPNNLQVEDFSSDSSSYDSSDDSDASDTSSDPDFGDLASEDESNDSDTTEEYVPYEIDVVE